MYKKIILTIFVVFVCLSLRAQMVINTDGTGYLDPHPAVALEVHSSDKGVIIPRLTHVQRMYIPVDSAAEGLLVYQTDKTSGFYLYNGTQWKCLNPIDMPDIGEGESLSFAEVAFSGNYKDLKNKPVIPDAITGIHKVAYTGSYTDLVDRPNIPVILDSNGNEQAMDFARVALTGDYLDLKNLPVIPKELTGLADIAFSGSYKDLKNKPVIPTKLSELEQNEYYRTVNDSERKKWNKAAERSVPTMLRELQSDYEHQTVTEAEKGKWNTAAETKIPTVLSELEQNEYYQTVTEKDKEKWNTSAEKKIPTKLSELEQDYNNMIITERDRDKWNEAVERSSFSGAWDDLIGKPTFAKVAVSGDCSDLINVPKIPTKLSELVQDEFNRTISDEERAKWNAKSNFSGNYVDLTDKPAIPKYLRELEQDFNHVLITEKDRDRWDEMASAASFDGSWNSLTDRPTIPTKLSELEQNEYYQTVSKADKDKWNEAEKRKIPTKLSELHEDLYHMLPTSADIKLWNESAERTVPTRLSQLVEDEDHQLVTREEKRQWDATKEKVGNFPSPGEINAWKNAANKVVFNGETWTEMYNSSVEIKAKLNSFENGAEGERLQNVAFTGSYNDLKHQPYVPTEKERGEWTTAAIKLKPVAFSGSYKDLVDTPKLAKVAITGSYDDLSNKPSTDKGDVTGSMEDGLKLKKDITLIGATTIQDGLTVTGSVDEGSNHPRVSITTTGNIKIKTPLRVSDAMSNGYNNYATTVGLSRALDSLKLIEAKEYAAKQAEIANGIIVMWAGASNKVPDCWSIFTPISGRFPVSVNVKGNNGLDPYVVNSLGGEEKHTLTAEEIASHSHNFTLFSNAVGTGGGEKALRPDADTEKDFQIHSNTTASTGGNVAHENRPPYYALYFLIRNNDTCKSPHTTAAGTEVYNQ